MAQEAKSKTIERIRLIANEYLVNVCFDITIEGTAYDIQNNKVSSWAVRNKIGQCLNKESGRFEFEPMPSNRDEAFLKKGRFDTAEEAVHCYIQNRHEQPFEDSMPDNMPTTAPDFGLIEPDDRNLSGKWKTGMSKGVIFQKDTDTVFDGLMVKYLQSAFIAGARYAADTTGPWETEAEKELAFNEWLNENFATA